MRLDLNEDYFNDNQVVLNLHGGEKYLGRVEVCIMTAYHTLCYKGREDSYAPTICKQLGFSPYGKFSCIIHFRMIVIMLILLQVQWLSEADFSLILSHLGGLPCLCSVPVTQQALLISVIISHCHSVYWMKLELFAKVGSS